VSVPPLSVVMPVRNALPYVEEAVTSIVAQTYEDFEFVIGDDGSTDGSWEALQRWAERDRRIRLLRKTGGPSGHVGVGNWMVSEARAPIVARIDGDDRCYPDRLRRQMEVLAAEPDAVLVGTGFDTVDGNGAYFRPVDYWRLLQPSTFSPFPHSSAMFRRDAFDRAGGYRPGANAWEDLDLYLRMARLGRVLVVPEVLTTLRHAHVSERLRTNPGAMEETFDRMYRCVSAYQRRGSYDAELDAPAPERLDPMAFVALGSLRLWSGERPQTLKRLLKRGALRFDARSIKALGWSAWAAVSAPSLRHALTLMLRLRNLGAAKKLAGTPWLEWRPLGPEARD
jgi:glycosyltransferase involved in cell wall biosynthesis